MGYLKRVRGLLSTGLAWAVSWASVGVAVGVYGWLRVPLEPMLSPLVFFPLPVALFAAFGGVSGAAFATTLAIAERRRALDDLSIRQTACWGALGGLVFPAVMVGLVGVGLPLGAAVAVVGVGAALGAGSAAGTLALARRESSMSDGDNEPARMESASGNLTYVAADERVNDRSLRSHCLSVRS